jgi:hypothetical protein
MGLCRGKHAEGGMEEFGSGNAEGGKKEGEKELKWEGGKRQD